VVKSAKRKDPDLTLADGTEVFLESPGILFEAAVFGRFPDLTEYQGARLERERKAEESGTEFAPTVEDRHREYELSILFVIYGTSKPRFSKERDPRDGARSVNSISTPDFWRIASAVQQRWEKERAEGAARVGPSAASAVSS